MQGVFFCLDIALSLKGIKLIINLFELFDKKDTSLKLVSEIYILNYYKTTIYLQ